MTLKDLSIEYWYKNESSPNEGRGSVRLIGQGKDLFGLASTYVYPRYYLDDDNVRMSQVPEDIIPNDNNWHHVVLVYNSKDFKIFFYVDGEKKFETDYVAKDMTVEKIEIKKEGWPYAIDELNIWQGVLTSQQISDIFSG